MKSQKKQYYDFPQGQQKYCNYIYIVGYCNVNVKLSNTN